MTGGQTTGQQGGGHPSIVPTARAAGVTRCRRPTRSVGERADGVRRLVLPGPAGRVVGRVGQHVVGDLVEQQLERGDPGGDVGVRAADEPGQVVVPAPETRRSGRTR